MDEQDAMALIRSKLEQVAGTAGTAADALVDLVTERSGGNPFYIEELISFIAGQGIDPSDEAAIRSIELPESLHSLVLSRIDTVARGAAPDAQGRQRRRAASSGRPRCPAPTPSLATAGGRRASTSTHCGRSTS